MNAKNRNPQLLDGSFTVHDGRRGSFFINLARGVWSLDFGSDHFGGSLGDSFHGRGIDVSSFPTSTPGILYDPVFPDTAETKPAAQFRADHAAEPASLNQTALRLGVRGRPEQLVLLNMRLGHDTPGELWITAPGGICWYEGQVQWALSYFH